MTIHERFPFTWKESRKKKVEDNKKNYDTYKESIEVLDLKARSYNALKRGAINTIGDLINARDRLPRIRNIGDKSAEEIYIKLSIYLNEIVERSAV